MSRPRISTKNTEKTPAGPTLWNPKKIPPKIPENAQNGGGIFGGGGVGAFGCCAQSRGSQGGGEGSISGEGRWLKNFVLGGGETVGA